MNTEALFLFLILLLGLVLCSFLGGTYNKEGMSNINIDSLQSNGNRNKNYNLTSNPISELLLVLVMYMIIIIIIVALLHNLQTVQHFMDLMAEP